MAYLYDQGYSFGEIEQAQAGINALMKQQLETAHDASSWLAPSAPGPAPVAIAQAAD